jgi:uncharacterized protein YegJ (DUF2314 family)
MTTTVSFFSGRHGRLVLAALAGVMVLGLSMTRIRAMEDRVIPIKSADAEMNAAIAKARASLPRFWASYEGHEPSEMGHSLKVRFVLSDNNVEHIWIVDVKKLTDNSYSGRFANTPDGLVGKHMDDITEFNEADISDWLFMRNDKIVGGETLRVLLKDMPKEEADAFRARLEMPQ